MPAHTLRLQILRHGHDQSYQFGVNGSSTRAFSWGVQSKRSYCGETEDAAIEKGIAFMVEHFVGVEGRYSRHPAHRLGIKTWLMAAGISPDLLRHNKRDDREAGLA